jgi:hypothetical protein
MIAARLNEASTWRGIIALITACGVGISPDRGEAIIACGLAVMGLLGAFIPDLKAPTVEPPKQ